MASNQKVNNKMDDSQFLDTRDRKEDGSDEQESENVDIQGVTVSKVLDIQEGNQHSPGLRTKIHNSHGS